MKKHLISLIVAPIVGAIAGYLLAGAISNGWFSSEWRMIKRPPGNVQRMVAVSEGSLWVQSDTGTFYYNENPYSCQTECWQEVSEIPTLPIIKPYEVSVDNFPCAPPPPLSRVTARISECRKEMWVDRNFVFALRGDGTIYLWQVNLAKEWTAFVFIMGICTGALALFIPTLIVLLFNWLSNRASQDFEFE